MMNWQNFYGGPVSVGFAGLAGSLFLLVVLWSLIWKGLALWKAAHEESKIWFAVLLVINTLGILEILYLYVFSKKSQKPVEAPKVEM